MYAFIPANFDEQKQEFILLPSQLIFKGTDNIYSQLEKLNLTQKET